MKRPLFLLSILIQVSFAVTVTSSRTLHFLAPDDREWFNGKPLLDLGNGNVIPMVYDTSNCGWWDYTFPNGVLPTQALIRLDSDPQNIVLGKNGLDDSEPLSINFTQIFSQVNPNGTELYFDPSAGYVGWTVMSSLDVRQCNNALPFLLYDTDAQLHGAFSCDNYPNVATSKCMYPSITYINISSKIPCIGVTPGIVKPTLDANRRPVYDSTSGCFQSAEAFNQLFQSTPNVNQVSCKDLSFTRSKNGDWTFDSDQTPERGFFPLEMNTGVVGTKRESYSRIPFGNGAGTLQTSGVNSAMLQSGFFPSDVNWSNENPATGRPYLFSYIPQKGEFSYGTNPNVYNNTAWSECPNVSNPGVCRVKAQRNQFFCSMTKFDFVYQEGQYFYFLGDDDFWLFINDKLVIDLGGMHMPAPGAVLLDTLAGLTLGNKYPMDLFHCDRRTDMSNFQIQTNITPHHPLTKAVQYTKGPVSGSFLFQFLSYPPQTCATMSDPQMSLVYPQYFRYSLISPTGAPVDGNSATQELDAYLPENATVWGGIRVHRDTLWLDSSKITLSGNYTLAIQTQQPVYRYSIPLRLIGTSSINSKTSKMKERAPRRKATYLLNGKYQGKIVDK